MNKGLVIGLGGAAVLVAGLVAFKWSLVEPEADGIAVAEADREVVVDVGAAAFVPQDVSAYSSTIGLGSRWDRVWTSNAVQNLFSLPAVQQMWMQAQQHPAYQSFLQTAMTHPLAVQGLPVLKDALSNEVFVCTGADVPELFHALADLRGELTFLQWQAGIAGATGGSPEDFDSAAVAVGLIESVLSRQDQLKAPSVLMGFRLSDAAAVTKFLDTWLPQIDAAPVGSFEKRDVNGVSFYVFEITAEGVPDEVMFEMAAALESEGIAPDVARRLESFIRGQRVSIAAGVLDDYLMLSFGSDQSLLEQWGKGESLASSKSFEPLLSRYKEGLASVSYTAASMAPEPLTSEDIENIAVGLISMIPEGAAPATLEERLLKDARMLAAEIVPDERHSTLSFSFDNKGVESWTFSGPFPASLDGSQKLSVMGHRSNQPILYSAARAAKSPETYDTAVKWLKTGYGYFDDFVVPQIPPDDREQFDEAMSVALPFLKSVDAATRDHLVPAVDGTQSLVLIDGDGSFTGPPEHPFPVPFPIPRFGAAVELNDAEQFKQAMTSYLDATRKLLSDIRELNPRALPPELTIPDPQTSPLAGATLYQYPLPIELGPDIVPCALMKDRLLVVSSSARLAAEMAGQQSLPTSPVVALDEPAGGAFVLELNGLWNYFRRLSGAVLAIESRSSRGARDQSNMIKLQVDVVIRSLSALKSYHSTTTEENGLTVKHSWFHIEDIDR